jgi:hypothetical protein
LTRFLQTPLVHLDSLHLDQINAGSYQIGVIAQAAGVLLVLITETEQATPVTGSFGLKSQVSDWLADVLTEELRLIVVDRGLVLLFVIRIVALIFS